MVLPTRVSKHNLAFWSLALFALFFPTFDAILDKTGAMLVNGGLIVLSAFFILLLHGGKISLPEKERWTWIKVFFGIYALYALLILGSSLFLSEDVIGRDLYEIHRPVLYFLLVVFFISWFRSVSDLKLVETFLVIFFFEAFILGILTMIPPLHPFVSFFTQREVIATRRLAAPFSNPYDLAFAMTLLIYFFGYRFLLISSGRWKSSAGLMISLLLLVMTQSRSVAGAMLVGMFFVLPCMLAINSWSRLRKLIVPKHFFIFVFGIVLFVSSITTVYLVYRDEIGYLAAGFEKVLQGKRLKPLESRQKQLEFAWDRASEDPFIFFFGNGPSKTIMPYPESIYTYFIFRYGFVGLLGVFFLPIILACAAGFRTMHSLSIQHRVLIMSFISWLLTMPIASVGNNFSEQVRLSFINCLVLACLVSVHAMVRSKR